ncbi:hypothetical protein FJT64_016001 [Amphibalanus amphitrite]|uniref:Uncharacterized protein n=1 Tax=Amphibalanus amphitrite TaxID=1232801 RepID=A0A6A4X188_AMPAM|nr:hypothetical protein FJT64_016001 [Amphibalanus amphitrite]
MAAQQPHQHKEHKPPWHTKAALLASAFLAFLVAVAAFVYVFQDRLSLYRLQGLVHIGHAQALPPEWLELAVCFGPRLPAGALRANVTGAVPASVDDAWSYRQLFGGDGGFDWRRPPFELLARPAAAVAGLLGRLQVTTSEPLQNELRYTDLPLMLHYSLCRNFSGFRWSPSHSETEHWLELSMSMEEHDLLLDGVTASFVEVYMYQRGRFNEFFSVSPLLAYRTDMKRPLRLRLDAQLHRHILQQDGPCTSHGEPTSCLFWCLMRSLLRRAGCTMPWMDALVFNMTAVRVLQRAVPTRRDPTVFSARTALPWMREFAAMRPCESADEFRTLFRLVDSLLLYETSAPDAAVQHCRTECRPICDDLVTRLRMVGGTLAEWHSSSLLRIELPHTMPVQHRRRLFETAALLLEVAGLLAFLFGASVLGVYGSCLWHARRVLDRAGLLERRGKEDDGAGDDGAGDDTALVDKGGRPEAGDEGPVGGVGGEHGEAEVRDGSVGGVPGESRRNIT